MKLTVRKGTMLSWGWLPPVSPIAARVHGAVGRLVAVLLAVPAHTHVPRELVGSHQQPTGEQTLGGLEQQAVQRPGADSTMDPGAIGLTGGSQPHDNMVPFLTVNFIISLFGIFPSQT